MLQVENAEFVRVKCLTIPTTLDCFEICGKCPCHLKGFLLYSLVTNRVLHEVVCLTSFDVLKCWLNLAVRS